MIYLLFIFFAGCQPNSHRLQSSELGTNTENISTAKEEKEIGRKKKRRRKIQWQRWREKVGGEVGEKYSMRYWGDKRVKVK